MSSEDIDALLASLTTMRDLAIVLLMLGGGLRPGEVLCLQLDDISYGHRRVTIRKRDDHPRGARAKARHERVVDLHEPRTLDALNRYVLHERPLDAESQLTALAYVSPAPLRPHPAHHPQTAWDLWRSSVAAVARVSGVGLR